MKPIKLLFAIAALFLTSCSGDDLPESSEGNGIQEVNIRSAEFLKSNELLEANFLPTFTSFYGKDGGTSTNRSSSLASEWIHEYDENDKLIKSYFFELYPYRLLREFKYLGTTENNSLKYEHKSYSYYGLLYSFSDTLELSFDENLKITTIGWEGTILKELDDNGRPTRIHEVTPNGPILFQTGYEYDEQGNILAYLGYNASGIQTSSVVYSYNEQGDPLSYHFTNPAGVESVANYQYRGDNTLERLEEEYYNDEDDFGTEIFTYTPEERLSKQISNKGDGSRDVVTYTEDEILAEYFNEEGLIYKTRSYWIQENNYYLNWQKEYLNGILQTIKYYDANEQLEYTEYYDENGNLTDTVYE